MKIELPHKLQLHKNKCRIRRNGRVVLSQHGDVMVKHHLIDKSGWIAGPWHAEPDDAEWTDDSTGLKCHIVRNEHNGFLRGEVEFPKGVPCVDRWKAVDGMRQDGCSRWIAVGPGVNTHFPYGFTVKDFDSFFPLFPKRNFITSDKYVTYEDVVCQCENMAQRITEVRDYGSVLNGFERAITVSPTEYFGGKRMSMPPFENAFPLYCGSVKQEKEMTMYCFEYLVAARVDADSKYEIVDGPKRVVCDADDLPFILAGNVPDGHDRKNVRFFAKKYDEMRISASC